MADTETIPKSAAAKSQQMARISAVNHWRGQCLDNFARVELAIIKCSEQLAPQVKAKPMTLEEAAAKRTQSLRTALLDNWGKNLAAVRLASLLDHWAIREKERNDLVHGRFSVRAGNDVDWLLVVELVSVKKGVVLTSRLTQNARQAGEFLSAIIGERKQLEAALEEVAELLGAN